MKLKFEFRGRCPACQSERSIICAWVEENAPSMDALEDELDRRGGFEAHCPKCDAVEDVAFFANNQQAEPWLNADEYERRNGPAAGPLPPKPW